MSCTRPKVGMDSYGLTPLGLEPLQVLRWAGEHGAQGVQFSGVEEEQQSLLDEVYLKEMRQYAADERMYLEWGGAQHIPRRMESWEAKDVFQVNRRAAEQARALGCRIIRSCSGGLMRWRDDSPLTDALIAESAGALTEQKSMLRDHGVVLAIETHFEFTTHELLRLLSMCEAEPGDWVGVCLDTMNLLTMLEEPVRATERILPWVVSTHIKDGGLLIGGNGLASFPAAMGEGVIDLERIIGLLADGGVEVNLSVEAHGGSFDLPIFDPAFLAEFPDLDAPELAALIELAVKTGRAQERGACGVTDRADWPRVCEARMEHDLHGLHRIVRKMFG